MEPGSNPASSLLHFIEVDGCLLSREGFSVLASRRLIQSWLIGMAVDSRTMLPAWEMMGNLLSAFLSLCPLGTCLSNCLPVIFCLPFSVPHWLSFLFISPLKPFVCVSYCTIVSVHLSHHHLASAPPTFVTKVMDDLSGPLRWAIKSIIQCLGVTMDQHIMLLVHSRFFHLRHMAKLRPIVSHLCCPTFYSCNSLFTPGQPSWIFNKWSEMLLLTCWSGPPKKSNLMPNEIALHGLPSKFRIQFKVLLITYRALHGQIPASIRQLRLPLVTSTWRFIFLPHR